MGVPSTYTDEIAEIICRRIAEGESLRTICLREGMPDRVTVWRWQKENEAFRSQYARAREQQAETFADEIITIADRAEDANIARLQVDARKWAASKLAPKKYGDKITNEHTGPDGGPMVVMSGVPRAND
jgi:hypothetical protein